MNKPLSAADVGRIIDELTGSTSFKIYLLDAFNKDTMRKMIKKKEEERYANKDFFLIFYDLAQVGHWCCMVIDYIERKAYFYCSFGVFIDEQYKYKVRGKKEGDLVKSTLRYLFRKGFEIHYNNKALQNVSSSVCGRYCALYIVMNISNDINPDDFNLLVEETCEKEGLSPDELILDITK